MLPKKCIPLYLEDLVFLIKRAGWIVTKIHSHLTFDQEPFKRDFILTNQKSRQESKTATEKDFFIQILDLIVEITWIIVILYQFLTK